jgi:hypothetical protein
MGTPKRRDSKAKGAALILRPVQFHFNDALGAERGDRAKKSTRRHLDATSSLRDVHHVIQSLMLRVKSSSFCGC